MVRKGFLLIDGFKNAVILTPDELKQAGLYDLVAKSGIMAKVRRHKTQAQLNKSVSEYLRDGWAEGETQK